MQDEKQGKILQGTVVSDKMQGTVVVKVNRRVKHKIYKKIVAKSKNYHVHDPEGKSKKGNVVEFKACKPISKTKSWVLMSVLG